jgi:hypothetical protein
MKIFLCLATLFLAPSVASGETAEEMLNGCRLIANAPVRDQQVQFPNTPDAHACWGALGVLQELWRRTVDGKHLPLFTFCVPDKVTRTQWAAVFIAYIEKNPRERHEAFALVALWAMADAFPCRP